MLLDMKLKAYFVKDWHDSLKDILVNHWGIDISKVDEKDLPIVYFNAQQRRIDQRPRKIEMSDDFQCPVELQEGWNKIQRQIYNGDDITPHLSKFVKDSDKKDEMLNDFGVHHFHLGTELKGDFIKRTKPLLFALVTNECLHAIKIYEHGQWTNSEIVEVIHRNWPDVIKKHIINGDHHKSNITDSERMILRGNNCNAFLTVSDGTTYAPIGGGVMGSGHNIQSIIEMDKQHVFLETLQNSLESQLVNIRPDLKKQGYNDEDELIAKLVITKTEYRAYFPKYLLEVILHIKS